MAISMEDVVRVLQSRIGARWEGIEGDGRDEMIRVLKKEFDVGGTEADDILDGLIRSGTIRYETHSSDRGEAETDLSAENVGGIPAVFPTAGLGASGAGGGIGTGGIGAGALAVPLASGGGYWRIGNEADIGV